MENKMYQNVCVCDSQSFHRRERHILHFPFGSLQHLRYGCNETKNYFTVTFDSFLFLFTSHNCIHVVTWIFSFNLILLSLLRIK